MFFLVLCKLFLWSMCWYINVVDAQPGDQPLKPGEYQLGIKQCEERCLDTGECRGFNYDRSALRCSLAFDGDNLQYTSTARTCGTSWCKRGERCLTTRKSHYVCVAYLAPEQEYIPEDEVKLDLKDLGLMKTHHYRISGCDTTKIKHKNRDYMFLLSLNHLIAIDMKSAKEKYTWPIVHRSKFQPRDLTSGYTENRERLIYIVVSTSTNDRIWLVSIKQSKLLTMKTIDLKNRKAVKPMTKSNHYHLYMYAFKLYLISTHPDLPHELHIAKIERKGKDYELKRFYYIDTLLVWVNGNPFSFFVYDSYVFVLVKRVLLRWRKVVTYPRAPGVDFDTIRMYRWDSPRDTVCSAVHQSQILYTVDKDNHLRKMEMYPLLRLFKILDN